MRGRGPAGRALAAALAIALAGCAVRPAGVAPEESAGEEGREPVEVRAAVDRAVATTGDLITYRVTIDYDEAYEVEVPEPGAEIAGFRIVDLGREEPRRRGGRVIEERWYELRADLVGSYVLPPLEVVYRPRAETPDAETPDGAAPARTVRASALFVEVESVLPAEGGAEDIRDLKPLRRVARPVPWGWIGGAAGALLLGAAAWVWWRRRRRPEAAPALPPHEIAFRALDALRGTDFDDPAAVRRFYFALSAVVRAYVEGRFALNATDLTSEEILARLDEVADLEGDPRGELRRFLLDTDQVKFAHRRPERDEIAQTYERALGFVETTLPRPEPEEDDDREEVRAA